MPAPLHSGNVESTFILSALSISRLPFAQAIKMARQS
jgi:hypothetical protein